MSDLIILRPITPEDATRILRSSPSAEDAWHEQYPFEDELDPLGTLAAAPFPDPVFTMYMVIEIATGLAVGGIGFFGPPGRDGVVELGFGLVPAARGRGLASDAVRAALAIAARNGAAMVVADTLQGNAASQRVLNHAGFTEIRRDADLVYFSRALVPANTATSRSRPRWK